MAPAVEAGMGLFALPAVVPVSGWIALAPIVTVAPTATFKHFGV